MRLPNLPNSSTSGTLQSASISAATAPALALGHVAQGVGKIAKQLTEHDAKIMQAQNDADLTEIKTHMKSSYANYQAGLVDDHDYKQYGNKWDKELSNMQANLDKGDYSQAVKDRARREFEEFKGDTRIGVAAATQKKAVERGKLAYANGFKMALDSYAPGTKNYSEIDSLLGDQTSFSPEQKEQQRMAFLDKANRKDLFNEVYEDPRSWLDSNPRPANGDTALWEAGKSKAKARLRELVDEQTDTVLNAITDRSLNANDIEALTPDLGEYERFKLGEVLEKQNDAVYQKKLRSPEEQQRLLGEVSNMIDNYEPSGETDDYAYADIVTAMEGLGNKAYKSELLKSIKAKREGAEEEIDTVRDWGRKQVSEFYKAGGYGNLPEVKKVRRSVRDHIKDGFFDDTEKLISLGFSAKEVEQIQEADEDVDPSIIGSVFTADNKVTAGARADKFAELWETRTGDVTAEFDAIDLANKLTKGRANLDTEFSSYDDPESITAHRQAKMKIEEQKGAVLGELESYLKLNPKATIKETSEQLIKIGVSVRAGSTDENYELGRPKRDIGVTPTYRSHKGSYRVINKTRDQISGFSSKAGNRMISLDFNDADNKSARGIEIKVPSDATSQEIEAAEAWARETQQFYKSNGINVPLRHGNGIKRGGRGVGGVFHTEPFFASNKNAIKLLQDKPEEYAQIVGRTLGHIKGAAFIPPHKSNDPGAVSGDINERDFAIKTILPYL